VTAPVPAAPARETLGAKIARLKDGTWHASETARQVYGDIWRKAPGGVPVRTRGQVYRGVIFRHPKDGSGSEVDACAHSHTKPGAAYRCAEREARRRNRQEAKDNARSKL